MSTLFLGSHKIISALVSLYVGLCELLARRNVTDFNAGRCHSRNRPARHPLFLQTALAMLALAGLASGAHAAITTFATFSESVGAPDFVFTNSSPNNATFTATSPIDFRYLNIVGLPADLRGIQSACINVAMTTTQPAVSAGGVPATLSQGFPVLVRAASDPPGFVEPRCLPPRFAVRRRRWAKKKGKSNEQ